MLSIATSNAQSHLNEEVVMDYVVRYRASEA